MGYYENKAKAYFDIRSMMEKNIPLEDIVFKIKTKYGFTEKFTRDYFDEIILRIKKQIRNNAEPVTTLADDKKKKFEEEFNQIMGNKNVA